MVAYWSCVLRFFVRCWRSSEFAAILQFISAALPYLPFLFFYEEEPAGLGLPYFWNGWSCLPSGGLPNLRVRFLSFFFGLDRGVVTSRSEAFWQSSVQYRSLLGLDALLPRLSLPPRLLFLFRELWVLDHVGRVPISLSLFLLSWPQVACRHF